MKSKKHPEWELDVENGTAKRIVTETLENCTDIGYSFSYSGTDSTAERIEVADELLDLMAKREWKLPDGWEWSLDAFSCRRHIYSAIRVNQVVVSATADNTVAVYTANIGCGVDIADLIPIANLVAKRNNLPVPEFCNSGDTDELCRKNNELSEQIDRLKQDLERERENSRKLSYHLQAIRETWEE